MFLSDSKAVPDFPLVFPGDSQRWFYWHRSGLHPRGCRALSIGTGCVFRGTRRRGPGNQTFSTHCARSPYMSKVRVGIKSMSALEKIAFARRIVAEMTNNPNFPSPSPNLAVMSAAAAALESAFAAAQSARQTAKALAAAQKAKE